jgi:hypothetical protein
VADNTYHSFFEKSFVAFVCWILPRHDLALAALGGIAEHSRPGYPLASVPWCSCHIGGAFDLRRFGHRFVLFGQVNLV